MAKRVVKYFLGGVASLVGLLMLLTALFYVPPVQRAVVKTACSFVSDSTMQVSVGDFRLRFPLCLDLSDVYVITEGDTLCALQSLHLEVESLPLLYLTAVVPELSLEKVLFHYTDTTGFQMGVRLDEASITSVSAKLLDESAEIGSIALSGGEVNMHLGLPDSATVTESADESEPLAWQFDVEQLSATNVVFQMSGTYEESLLLAGADVITVARTSVDLGKQTVDVDSLCLRGGDVAMLSDTTVVVPTSETDGMEADSEEVPSLPWTIRTNGIRIDDTDIVYGQMGYRAQPGFDAGYISITSLSVALDSVYNRGADMAARLSALSFDERSGLSVRSGSAFLSMDSTALQVNGFRLETDHSLLSVDVFADGPLLSMKGDAGLDVSMDWKLGLSDVALFVPTVESMASTLPFDAVSGALKIGGTLDNLSVRKFYTELPQTADFRLEGDVQSLTAPDSLRAKMDFMAHLDRLDFLPEWIGGNEMSEQVSLPDSMSLQASLDFSNNQMAKACLSWNVLQGDMNLDAEFAFPDMAYRVVSGWRNFPLDAFLPHENLGILSMSLSAKGRGLDPFSSRTEVDLSLHVDTIDYGEYSFRDFLLDATLDSGNVTTHIGCGDSAVQMDLQLAGRLSPSEYSAHLTGRVEQLDLKTTHLMEDSLTFSASVDVEAWANDKMECAVKTSFDEVALYLSDMESRFDHIAVTADMLQDSIDARVDFPGIQVAFSAPTGLDSLLARVTKCLDILQQSIDTKDIVPADLCESLPDFSVTGSLVPEQIIDKLLQDNGLSLDSLQFSAEKSAITPFEFSAEARNVALSSFSMDTLTIHLQQDDEMLRYAVCMKESPETSDLLAEAGVSGFVGRGELFAALRQKDQEQIPGLVLDIDVYLSDSAVSVTLGPDAPVLGVPDWSLNEVNFIDYYFDGRMAADLQLRHDIQLLSLRSGLTPGSDAIHLNIENLKVAPILQTLPGMPPISTFLSTALTADLSSSYPAVDGTIRLDSTQYDSNWMGNIALAIDYHQSSASTMEANLSLDVDTLRAVTLSAVYETDTLSSSPLDLSVEIPNFPLSLANAFLPDDLIQLEGYLQGYVSASGNVDAPHIDGVLSIDGCVADIPMMGASFRFSPAHISMADNVVSIDTFNVWGSNEEPLRIKGNIGLSDFSRPYVDVAVKAYNFELFNVPRNRTTTIYGTASSDIDVSVCGYLDDLSIRGNVDLLNGTETTYVLRENYSLPGTSDYGDMVVFTSFSDTIAEEDILHFQPVSGVDMLVNVDIGNAVALSVELTPDGNSRIDLQGGGSLTYTMNKLGDNRFTGRYELSGGTVCYTPPLIGQKLFTIKEGSSVIWEGEIANPIMDITALDKLSVNVNSNGTTRTVQFQVSISILNSLDNLSIVFDVAAPLDMTIQNELSSMTDEQRASQAMSLLIYGMYTGPSSSQNDFFSSANMLNQFLQNELNKWSRNNLKNVDLRFGINSREEADGTTHTDYSYQISKKFFNDRVRIVVGGSYSPDDDSDALKQNLVDDISLEYKLDKRDNMILKIFRHTGQITILEGEVTKTGLGFSVRKKLARLSELFHRSQKTSSQTHSLQQS